MTDAAGARRDLLSWVVPGSPLREGLERILRAQMGALIVLGDGPEVLRICSGGFHLDAEMSPQRLSELAKMDGAIILDREARRIAWANVHLIPDPAALTTETGTRHRTAERVARSVGVAVVAVSEENRTITLYQGDLRRQLEGTDSLIGRVNHLLQTLERFRGRFDQTLDELERAEREDGVTLRHVATVLQRAEMVLRVGRAVRELVAELGAHGRLLKLQLEELVAGVDEDRHLVLLDYLGADEEHDQRLDESTDSALEHLAALSTDELLGLEHVASVLRCCDWLEIDATDLDARVEPRGWRLLRRVPQLSGRLLDGLVTHFEDVTALRRATLAELVAAGIDETDAARLQAGLERLEMPSRERV